MHNQKLQVESEENLRETKKGRQFKCERCKHWRHWDNGHSEGNECVQCWAEIERKLLMFVAEAKWRLETTIVDYMLKQEPTLHYKRVESWLAELVEIDGSLEWFPRGPEEKIGTIAYCEEPLRYKFIPKHKRRKEKGNGNRRTHRHQRPVRKLQAVT